MEHFVTIELFGEHYKFKSEHEVPYAEEIAELIVQEVIKVEQEHMGKSMRMSKFAQLLLATMNISSKYYELKQDQEKLKTGISERSAAIINNIDKKVSKDMG